MQNNTYAQMRQNVVSKTQKPYIDKDFLISFSLTPWGET